MWVMSCESGGVREREREREGKIETIFYAQSVCNLGVSIKSVQFSSNNIKNSFISSRMMALL